MAQQKKTGAEKKQPSQPGLVTIKKYANRRLYNTATSAYVTLEYLAEMIRKGEDFIVIEAKSGDEITRSVLTQIIVEEENKGQNLLPVKFLRQIIGYYGDNLQSFVPSYLEVSMETFRQNQEAMRQSLTQKIGTTPGFKIFEDVTRQNMAMFQQGLKMMGIDPATAGWTGSPPAKQVKNNELEEIKAENTELHRQLATLKNKLQKSQNDPN